jgi:hypothetical protein
MPALPVTTPFTPLLGPPPSLAALQIQPASMPALPVTTRFTTLLGPPPSLAALQIQPASMPALPVMTHFMIIPVVDYPTTRVGIHAAICLTWITLACTSRSRFAFTIVCLKR